MLSDHAPFNWWVVLCTNVVYLLAAAPIVHHLHVRSDQHTANWTHISDQGGVSSGQKSIPNISMGHSLRLNAEVVVRAWKILGSLVVGVKILLHFVILLSICLVRNLQKNGKNVQNQSSCGSALGTALTDRRSDMCDFSTYFWRLRWRI